MSHPYIDIYVLLDDRNPQVIDTFLNDFTDRSAIEDRMDEELMILNINATPTHPYIWKKAETLTKSIEFGLSESNICFTLFLLSNYPDIEWVTITFTVDGKLVFGLSVFEYRDEQQTLDNYKLAESFKAQLLSQYNGKNGVIGLEADIPQSESEFLELKKIWKN